MTRPTLTTSHATDLSLGAAPRRASPRAWDSATVASSAISLTLLTVIGLSACGPQDGAMSSRNAATGSTASPTTAQAPARAEAPRAPVARYAVVRKVEPIVQQGETNGTGAVIGGVLGAVAGNQIGDGSGRTVATVAGAAGGAYVGNRVEKSRREKVVGYRVHVEMPDGTPRTFREDQIGGMQVGDRVRVVDGHLQQG